MKRWTEAEVTALFIIGNKKLIICLPKQLPTVNAVMTYIVAEKFRTANVEECCFGFLFKLLWPSKCIRYYHTQFCKELSFELGEYYIMHILDSSVNYFTCTELA